MEKVWYYMKKDKSKYGPYSDNELCALIHQGIIDANEWIWMPDMKGWLKVANSIYSVYLPETEDDLGLQGFSRVFLWYTNFVETVDGKQ